MKSSIRNTAILFLAAVLLNLVGVVSAAPGPDYAALKKFLGARMYYEAYDELLRCELLAEKQDPKLAKLKKEILSAARREAGNRVKMNPDDTSALTVLADIDYQENQVDIGVQKISKAMQKNPGTVTHYVFAKMMFAKGDFQQSYEAMEKAFQADPTSEAIMADFQFLYNCKNYGLETGKKISQNTEFLQRASQVGSGQQLAGKPESPFENDPTVPPTPTVPPEPDPPEPDPLLTAKPPDEPTPKPTPKPTGAPIPTEKPEPPPPTAFPDDDPLSFPDDPGKTPAPDQPAPPQITIADQPPDEGDPEKKKMVAAENLLKEAEAKLEEFRFDDARMLLKKAQATFPGIPGAGQLEKRLKQNLEISEKTEQEYLTAVKLFEADQWELAVKGIQKAYDLNPNKRPEARFYLGKIYFLGPDSVKDLKKARHYFDLCLKDPQLDPDLKRDIEWFVVDLLTEDKEFVDALARFQDLENRERDYVKSRSSYLQLKYYLFYKNYAVEMVLSLAVFFGLFFLILVLPHIPNIGLYFGDPLKKAKKAMEKKDFERALHVAEDALRRGTQPTPAQKELLEICIQVHFMFKNYFKCLDHAKHLKNMAPENQVALKHLTLCFLETKASHDEAIATYEEAYKRDPQNKIFLPFLAKYYIAHKQFTVESLNLMYDYFQADRHNRENVQALAETYVQTKRMGDEVIFVLEEALKDKPNELTYRELLARNFVKAGKFPEASRECLKILQTDVNNMGIHVVYTSSMKKLNMLEEAVLQYEEFLKRHPGNGQITEILTGLRKELEQSAPVGKGGRQNEDLSPFSDDLIVDVHSPMTPKASNPGKTAKPTRSVKPALPENDGADFVEPPPDGFDPEASDVPIPDFMKQEAADLQAGHPAEDIPEVPPDFETPVPPPTGKGAWNEVLESDPDAIDADDPVPLPPKLPKAVMKPQALGKKRNALEEFIDDGSPLGGDFMAGDDDLTKEILADSEAIPDEVLEEKDVEDVFLGSKDLPDTLSPKRSGHEPDPFAGAGETLDDDLASLLTSSPKKSGKPTTGTAAPSTPRKGNPPSARSAGEGLGVPPLMIHKKGAKAPGSANHSGVPDPTMVGEDPLSQARRQAANAKWNEVITLLAPAFAGNRDRSIGLMLANAYLRQKKPELARDIISTLDFDPELMTEEIKDIIYRVGVALEEGQKVPEALSMYDIICGVDINYLDVFDRSERLYAGNRKNQPS
jgi:tetratricopeptide (TPR) repeat protein